jgi:hypothetical protein
MNPETTNLITLIATCVTAGIALVAAIISIWQAHFTTRVQALLQVDAVWTSDLMRANRRKAAASLLADSPTAELDRILDYFETIAGIFVTPHGLFRSRVIPDSWARHTFYWSAACYWTASREYIKEVRQKPSEQDAWKDLDELIPRWIKAEGSAPTEKDIGGFLDDEQNA